MLVPQLPPEALELLDDPRAADLKYRGPTWPTDMRVLQPPDPPLKGESRFLLLSIVSERTEILNATSWPSMPGGVCHLAYAGLDVLRTETQRFVTEARKPEVLPVAWLSDGVFVAAPELVEVVRKHDPDAIDIVEVDWTFADGEKVEGYAFVYVRRVLQAYDWKRSAVIVKHDSKRKYIAGLGRTRALRRQLPSDMHIFRDAYCLQDVFVSPQLGADLVLIGTPDLYLVDPATMRAAKV